MGRCRPFGRPALPTEPTAVMGTNARAVAPLPPEIPEDLVPPDRFSRHPERALDLAFVRDPVEETYAQAGRPSIDPVVFSKLRLEPYFEGLRSERQLLRVAADRLGVRWYLGYDLAERLPDHSSLTRIHGRFGLDVSRRLFEAIAEHRVQARLVWGRELYVDSTQVEANASPDSLRPRFAVEAHLGRLFPPGPAGDDGGGGGPECPEPVPFPGDPTEAARAGLAAAADDRHDWIGEAGRPDRAGTSGAYRHTADFRSSATDPDASPVRPTDGRSRLGYRDHCVVDGGKARIVPTALVTPAEVQDTQPALDLLWRARFHWEPRPRQATGGAKSGTVDNITAIEDRGIRAYVPLPEVGRRPELFADTGFSHDAAADADRCPREQTLRLISRCETARRRVCEAPTAACRGSTLEARCAMSQRGRRVGRGFDEAYLGRVRGYHGSEPYAKAMRKRKGWDEPLFAEAEAWHGLRRLRLRGLPQVTGEALLVAAGQDPKRLLSRRGRGRRSWPRGAAGTVPVATTPPVPVPDRAASPPQVAPIVRDRSVRPYLFQHAVPFLR